MWKSNRSLTGYNIGDLGPPRPRARSAATRWRPSHCSPPGAIRLDVTAELPLGGGVGRADAAMQAGRTMGKTLLAVNPGLT